MSKRGDKQANERRWRVTVVVEGRDADLDEALRVGMMFAQDRSIGIRLGSKIPGGPTIECRTVRARKKVPR